MIDYNKDSEKVNRDFNNTFWQTVGTGAGEPAPRSFAARKDAAAVPDDPSPRSPNRGDDKYRGICCNSLDSKCLTPISGVHPSSGVDYLCFGVFGCWRFEEVLDTLNSSKADGVSDLELFGELVRLEPSGLRDGVYYAYVLTWHGVKILINPSASGTIAPVRVHVPGLVLMQTDWRVVVDCVLSLLASWSFEVEYTTVSRVDLQVTLEMPFGDIAADVSSPRVVTDCRGDQVTYRDLKTGCASTVWFRSKTIELCIYDKSRELSSSAVSPEYRAVWSSLFLDDGEPLSRVEFRLRSDALRRWGVRTVEDLVCMLPAVADRLTSVWFRVLRSNKVRGHENKAELSRTWSIVRAAFLQTFDGSLRQIVPIQRQKQASVERLVKIARGCIASAVPLLSDGGEFEDLDNAYRSIVQMVKQEIDDKIRDKAQEFYQYTT